MDMSYLPVPIAKERKDTYVSLAPKKYKHTPKWYKKKMLQELLSFVHDPYKFLYLRPITDEDEDEYATIKIVRPIF